MLTKTTIEILSRFEPFRVPGSGDTLVPLVTVLIVALVVLIALFIVFIMRMNKYAKELSELRGSCGKALEFIFRGVLVTESDTDSEVKRKIKFQQAIRKTKFGTICRMGPNESAIEWERGVKADLVRIEQHVKEEMRERALYEAVQSMSPDSPAREEKHERGTGPVVGNPMVPEETEKR